ncbi:hypothetical protein N5915_03965 [Arcobacter lacus]|uniref:Uncharacterized protein n=1 Tax=Arcobacter lacus TaxID=1912876 RepID=A0ABX5JKB7_9BACT|nr:hypothetical protein [Arcobacter lacus]MCT7908707.1 hypothetical protein [Arcobacter lacus]MCT7911197.1 hypothetical protein [Arcobacter lacus]PUE64585.1 hypothetical protein B0175_09190 [Arcobacter lacus]
MNKIEELQKILKTDVLLEVEAEIDALQKLIAKNKSKDLENELEYMLDVKKFYDEALILIEKGKLTQEEAINILLDLEDMRADDEDEI